MPGVWTRQHDALPLDDALIACAKLCATNVATMIGLHAAPDGGTGSIAPGMRADLVAGSLEGKPGRYQFRVQQLFVGGRSIPLRRPTEQETLAVLKG